MRRNARHFASYRPETTGFVELGLDYVVAADLKPWLIEVNHQPQVWGCV